MTHVFRCVAEPDSDDHDAAERREELKMSVIFGLLHEETGSTEVQYHIMCKMQNYVNLHSNTIIWSVYWLSSVKTKPKIVREDFARIATYTPTQVFSSHSIFTLFTNSNMTNCCLSFLTNAAIPSKRQRDTCCL